jgi:hypothetical protein
VVHLLRNPWPTSVGIRKCGFLKALAVARGPLLREVVFVGGQVAELLVTSVGATRVGDGLQVRIPGASVFLASKTMLSAK